jgi:hypothetical protein
MIGMLRAAADQLEQMKRDGVTLEDEDAVSDDYAHLVTFDAKIAEKYGMLDEGEFWGIDEDDDEADAP